ncbi:MAG TPA: hypothetical protein VHL11_02560, partial [Phototrophicaceae bacterium]|nr:hypothetical protein [Phototrophicaceae bacterium]
MTSPYVPLIRVFISSPGDVPSERKIAREVIDQLNYEPAFKDKILIRAVAWDNPNDSAPMVAYLDPQEVINRGLARPAECEIVAVMLWSRMGTPMAFPKYQKSDGTPYQSGTEWE